MRRPGVPSDGDQCSDWKDAFVVGLVRLCPDVGVDAAAEVAEAALVTNHGMPPWMAAAEWALLWARRVRPDTGASASAPKQQRN